LNIEVKMRTFKYDILKEIKERWSARAFKSKAVSKEDIYAILEAASYAPSSNNEQPWRFIVGFEPSTLQLLQATLTPSNLEWAQHAPVLIALISKRTYTRNDKENSYHQFDAGTAFAFLALEATKRGLIAHSMGGFDKELVRSSFNLSDDYSVILMIAIGYQGDKSTLSEAQQAREVPGLRKSLEEIIIKE
jgi:nitroreductase